MPQEKKQTGENTRRADTYRKDKGDRGKKFDKSKGADYQVPIADPGVTQDAIKEDRE